MFSEINRFELPNGLRVVHHRVQGEVAHCAILVDAGTRDEPEGLEGLAHFIEHTLFKGTKKRSPMRILEAVDSVGGELNAWTSKEETCIYASVPKKYLGKAVDLIADIVLHAQFPKTELEKEKDVVAEEIRSYQDSPSEQLFDDFETQVFGKHPLGRNILGTEDSLKKFTRADLLQFVKTHYTTSHLVLAISADVETEAIKQLALRHFEHLRSSTRTERRNRFTRYRPQEKTEKRDTHQAHCMIGAPAFSAAHPNRTALALITNVLGGPALNSRLNISIREKAGLAYTVEANYTVYSDSGLFQIYFGTDTSQVDRCMHIIDKELSKFRDQKLSPAKLKAAVRQLEGQLLLNRENKLSVLTNLARQVLLFDRIETPETVQKRLLALSPEQLQDVSQKLFHPKQLSRLSFLG